jgi:arsenate reductase
MPGRRYRPPDGIWREGVPVAAKVMTIYGIKACDTMQKARAWLADHGVDYAFHDYKTQGVDRARLEGWAKAVGWEALLNRSGTTFRKLPDADKSDLNPAKAIGLMLAQPSMIKRPVLETDGGLIVGFKPEIYAARLG